MPKMDGIPKKVEKIAIDLVDLERIDPIMRVRALHGRLDLANPVRLKDAVLIAFSCSLFESALVADMIQSEFRREGDRPAGIYLLPVDGTWRRLSTSTVYTLVNETGVLLNYDVFPSAKPKVNDIPLPTKRVEL